MSENNTAETVTSGEATAQTGQPTIARYRVYGSIRLTVTVTATSPDEATQAVPAVVTDVFAGLPGTVIPPEGLAIGIPTPLPSAGTEPSHYLVPVTAHGHVEIASTDLFADGGGDPLDAALTMVATHLDGRDDVVADLDTAVCDHVSEVEDAQPSE
jgi:hypothetical protein